MPDGLDVHVYGLQELATALNEIPAQFSTRIMREALHVFGEVVQGAAESTAPVRTGELRDDIVVKVHVGSDLSNNYVLIGPGYDRGSLLVRGVRQGRHGVEAVVNTTDSPGVYGKFVEEGHKGPGDSHSNAFSLEFGGAGAPPHPWLRPAWEISKEPAFGAFLAYCRGGLEAVVLAVRF